MDNLKDPTFVANSVLQHTRIRRIDALKIKTCEDDAKLYITALVCLEFANSGFSPGTLVPPTLLGVDAPSTHKTYSSKESYESIIKRKENKLSKSIPDSDMNALCSKAIEIAQASIKIHSDPAGIGHAPDKELGTDKQVFSILGPHLGHYYGDVIIVFKREILHHPDANFSVQAATSFASGNAYKWRPWLGADSKDMGERVKHYHRTKLHASVPGCDYATALELMALTSHRSNSRTMDISLEQILGQWVKNDSHNNIEAHLPQLIPLDYIDHIYIPKNLFSELSENALKAIDAVFKHRVTIVSHDGAANLQRGPFGPTPTLKSRVDYQNFVINELISRYKQNAADSLSKPVEGIAITLPSTSFDDHYVLPLTISQAFAQYRLENPHPSKDNITYIYWKTMDGDMMLTLSNEEIDQSEKQPNLRCLICYIAPKSTLDNYHHFEHTSYLCSGHPFQHDMIINNKTYKARSNTFYIGCNTSDFITYCLAIHRSTGKVILSHAGPNGIYNHEEISCTFGKTELDLNRLEFIHVSAGAHTARIRNLMICFEKQSDMHPTFDKDYKKDTTSATENRSTTAHTEDDHRSEHDAHHSPSPKAADNKSSKSSGFSTQLRNCFVRDLEPCPNNINCLMQYSENAGDHNSKYSHPCRYSELCRDRESHLTHKPHPVPTCKDDRRCSKLDDPFHRASYRHTGWPDFLIPCYQQGKCKNKSNSHRKLYYHGEPVFERLPMPELAGKG
jgi:hypothetical protein